MMGFPKVLSQTDWAESARGSERGGLYFCPTSTIQILAFPTTMEAQICTSKDMEYGSCSRHTQFSARQGLV